MSDATTQPSSVTNHRRLAFQSPVLVTGATGFIGTHVVRELLERGYRVRAGMRSVGDDKTAHLTRLAGSAERLELVRIDVLEPLSLKAAVQGCEGVVHVAASVRFAAANPQRDIVDVAEQGTRHILEAAFEAGSVRRFVLTSSVAAVMSYGEGSERTFCESDWAEGNTVRSNPYAVAKTLSERFAWDFVREHSGRRAITGRSH